MLLSTPPLKDTSDKELVFLLIAGDEQAFYALYARYWTRLKGFCRQFLKSEDLAENYAQDIFLKIWETRELLDPERSFSAYLYTIARNTVFNYLRHVAVSENASRKLIRDYRRCRGSRRRRRDYRTRLSRFATPSHRAAYAPATAGFPPEPGQ